MATQIGAFMPRSYFSATAKWVGLVMTTEAFGTAAIMRLRDARLADLPDLALDRGIAFGLLELLLELVHRHLLALEPLPVLEQIVGRRDQREHRHHGAEHLQRQRLRDRQHGGGIDAHQRVEPEALRATAAPS